LKKIICFLIYPLSANVEYTPHDGVVTCSCCGASYKLLEHFQLVRAA